MKSSERETSVAHADPERIGPWTIERKIGSGGMGNVYLGTHEETGQQAAVKALPPSLAREEGFIIRFNREVEAMQKLQNPHIVGFYDSGTDGDTWYYAMEYVEGETITDRIRREKRIPWRDVIEIAVQICTALKAAHDAGVVHRDLKPSNLLLAGDGTVKLTDFGVAQVFAANKLTATGGIIGTAEYMSPEQAQGQRATKRSDLYSLGAVMYVMLTGRPPFTGNSMLEVIQKHKFGQFDRPRTIVPDVPHWLDEIVCQLMEKDPEKRFPDAYVVSRRLQEIVRKLELQRGETFSDDPPSAELATQVDNAGELGGGATLMRDLMRAEIERQHRATPLQEFLNSTWFLVTALVLVLAGGVLWWRGLPSTPEQKFAAAERILEQPAGPEWLRAREEFLLPLVSSDPERWSGPAEPYLSRIEQYELESKLAPGKLLVRRRGKETEAERILRLARYYAEIGETARAERTLEALATMLAGDEEQAPILAVTEKLLAELRAQRDEQPEREALVRSALDRADRMAAEGNHAAARSVWSSIIELYGDDDRMSPVVQEARERLQ